MNRVFFIFFIFFVISCQDRSLNKYVPESSGNINNVTIVMSDNHWKGPLGNKTRHFFGKIYEGLPVDEPEFSIKHIDTRIFNGFARQSRNIIEFVDDSLPKFSLFSDVYARPQVLARVHGNDYDEMTFLLEENKELLRGVIYQNEFKEKTRRILKALSSDMVIESRFGIKIKYPTAYKTVKDTLNFTWIQKQIPKGHLNIVIYSIPGYFTGEKINKTIIKIRDSIGKVYIPGRLKGSYMITEKAYRPYFYKTVLSERNAILTKGTWEVANDFMAGPFINYMVEDSLNNRRIIIEGFTFAPSAKKRDYMFELETIIKSTSFKH